MRYSLLLAIICSWVAACDDTTLQMSPAPDMMSPEPDMMSPAPDMMSPAPDMMSPAPDMMSPEPDMMSPELDMMSPEPDMMSPEPDMSAPQAVCGDGLREGWELCDEGARNNNTLPYACHTDCRPDYQDVVLPFLEASYIAQGVASSCESLEADECQEERLYVSFYYKNAEGDDASNPSYAERLSLVAELNPNSLPAFQLTRCWRLNGATARSHVGGLAFAQTASGERYLYVSALGLLERYALPSRAEHPEGGRASLEYASVESCELLGGPASQSWSVEASSFTSHVRYQGLDYLFVGRFCELPTCSPRVYGYELDLNSGAITGSGPQLELVTRKRAQGVDVDGEYLYVSTSYGDNQSYLYQDLLSASLCDPTRGCAQASPQQVSRVAVKGGVAGGEDLARVGRHLWSLSESGSRHFQNRAFGAWSSYFPYLYDLHLDRPLSSPRPPVEESINSHHIPNVRRLFQDLYASWWERPELIHVLDANGDGREDLLLGPQESDGCWFLLEGAQDELGGPTLLNRGCVVQGYAGWHDNTDRVRVMDVNGDDRDDVVIGPYSADGCWYILQGAQQNEGATLLNQGCSVRYKGSWFDKAERIRALDVDGDGADDLLIGPSSAGRWYALKGQRGALASFQEGAELTSIAARYGAWWDQASRINTLDLNGDGADEVLIGPHEQDGCWYVLQGDASGELIDRGCVLQAEGDWAGNSERFWRADFTGDQRDDVLLGPSGVNGCWYLLRGSGTTSAGLTYEGCVHQNYQHWSDNARRIRLHQAHPDAPMSLLLGPKTSLGEWQHLQGHAEGSAGSTYGLYDSQWLVNTLEVWGDEDSDQRPERIRSLDLNGDGRDEVLIGPSSAGAWYVLDGR